MFDFQKLTVYQMAKYFHGFCMDLIESNQFSRFSNDQLGRTSFSVVLNIAEISGRFSKAGRKKFFVLPEVLYLSALILWMCYIATVNY